MVHGIVLECCSMLRDASALLLCGWGLELRTSSTLSNHSTHLRTTMHETLCRNMSHRALARRAPLLAAITRSCSRLIFLARFLAVAAFSPTQFLVLHTIWFGARWHGNNHIKKTNERLSDRTKC